MADARHAAFLNALGVDVYVARDTPLQSFEVETARGRAQDSHVFRPHEEIGGVESIRTQRPSRMPPVLPPPDMERAASVQGQAPLTTPPGANPGAGLDWEALRATVASCERCALHATRKQTVFGVGNRHARWMFIGEAPGADEDQQGEPFVGRAGQLLTSMIRALGFQREDVFIANVLKCRPPENRDPRPEEAMACRSFLERQVELVNPALIVAVGRICAQNLLATETPIAKLRGKVHSFGSRNWPLIVTYHPAYLLRSPSEKRKSWQDLLFARQVYARLEREAGSIQ